MVCHFPGFDGNREDIFPRGKRAGEALAVSAKRIVGLVEVECNRRCARSFFDIEVSAGAIGFERGSFIGESQEQSSAIRTAIGNFEYQQLVVLVVKMEGSVGVFKIALLLT